jgi:alkylation response protein AidB-like acyl-CoA dehydrogenase
MPPVLENYNMFTSDITLMEAVSREGADWAQQDLTEYGRLCGSAEWIMRGVEANRVKPVLDTHDRYGNRIDQVTFHPAYHELMSTSIAQGIGGAPWASPGVGAHVARAAGSYMTNQVEAGHHCPVTMTFASVPALLKQEEIAEVWLPKVLSTEYDPRNVPHTEKKSVTIGMAMTEKQGGSDVRRNTTRAYPMGLPGPGRTYELVGHKFFVSAPMCDAFLMLAQAEGGISCFYLDRQPLMQNVLADLELEAEAATHLAFRVARALDGMQAGNAEEASFARIATAVGKYWVCKRSPGHAYEAMECIGGSAVMENSLMPRFYREAPINTIWEGSGNVQCLDVLRAVRKDPESLQAFLVEVGRGAGKDERFDRYFSQLQSEFTDLESIEYRARCVVEKMALALQGSLLLRHAPESVSRAFCAARLGDGSGHTYGMLPAGVDCALLIDRGRLRNLEQFGHEKMRA